MTHEELLARINEIATVKFSEVELESTWTRLCKLPEALRAVVELAKETYIIKPYTNYHLGYQTAIKEVIQAIEEQLNG